MCVYVNYFVYTYIQNKNNIWFLDVIFEEIFYFCTLEDLTVCGGRLLSGFGRGVLDKDSSLSSVNTMEHQYPCKSYVCSCHF